MLRVLVVLVLLGCGKTKPVRVPPDAEPPVERVIPSADPMLIRGPYREPEVTGAATGDPPSSVPTPE